MIFAEVEVEDEVRDIAAAATTSARSEEVRVRATRPPREKPVDGRAIGIRICIELANETAARFVGLWPNRIKSRLRRQDAAAAVVTEQLAHGTDDEPIA